MVRNNIFLRINMIGVINKLEEKQIDRYDGR